MEKTKKLGELHNSNLPPLPCACPALCDPRERHHRSKHEQSDFDRWLRRMQRQVACCSALAEFEKMARARQYADHLVTRSQPLRSGENDWKVSEENCHRHGPSLLLDKTDFKKDDFEIERHVKQIQEDLKALELCTQRNIDTVREWTIMEDFLEL